MAAAIIKERSTTPHKVIKSTEIKTTTHVEILNVGNKVFEKEIKEQHLLFEEELIKREKNLIEKLQNEHMENIRILEKQHKEDMKSLKVKYVQIQNEALKEEASRIEDIMNKISTELVEETILDGQKNLDAALIVARDDFHLKKEKEIKLVVAQQQDIAMDLLKQKEADHEHYIKILNKECEINLEKVSEDFSKDMEVKLTEERHKLREQFKVELATALDDSNDKHKKHVEELNNVIQAEKNEQENLKQEIESLENKLREAKDYLKTVMASFQRFIESSPGFHEGQADFVLQSLLPLSLDEYLYAETKVAVLSETKDVPVLTKTNDVPVLSETNDVPVLTETNEVPVLSETKDVPVLTETNDVPVLSETKDVPVLIETNEVSVLSETKDVPVLTETNEFLVLTETNEVPVLTETKVPVLTETNEVPVLTENEVLPDS